MLTKTLHMMEDKIMGHLGLYTMWTMFFISNLAVLAEDHTRGASRVFNIIAKTTKFFKIFIFELLTE